MKHDVNRIDVVSPDMQNPDRSHGRELGVPLPHGLAEYRMLANALPQIIWTCDARGAPRMGQRSMVRADRPERGGVAHDKGALVAVHPDDREELATTSGHRRSRRRRRANSSTGSGTREGAYRWHLARVVPVRNEDGVITRWVAAAFDIHDRRHGGGRAARVRATVRDGLPPQSAADRDHPPGRRHVPQRQRRVREADRLLARRGGRQERRRARHLDRRANAPRSSSPLHAARDGQQPSSVSDQGRAAPRAGGRQRAHRLRRRALSGERGDRRDGAPRQRGRVAAERGAGARACRRARGADGRGAGRGVDLAGPRLPRDARQSRRTRALAHATRVRISRRRPTTRRPRGTSKCS